MGVKYLLCDIYVTAKRIVKVQIKIRIQYPLAPNEKMIKLRSNSKPKKESASLGDLANRRIKNAAFHPQTDIRQPGL
jgi:hypothetical protein